MLDVLSLCPRDRNIIALRLWGRLSTHTCCICRLCVFDFWWLALLWRLRRPDTAAEHAPCQIRFARDLRRPQVFAMCICRVSAFVCVSREHVRVRRGSTLCSKCTAFQLQLGSALKNFSLGIHICLGMPLQSGCTRQICRCALDMCTRVSPSPRPAPLLIASSMHLTTARG